MRTSMLVLLLLLAGVIGFALGGNHASVWYLYVALIGFAAIIQVAYLVGAAVAH